MKDRYLKWCIIFEDSLERNISILDEQGKMRVEQFLVYVITSINDIIGEKCGQVDVDSLLLLRHDVDFEYTLYFIIENSPSDGWSKEMFNQKATR